MDKPKFSCKVIKEIHDWNYNMYLLEDGTVHYVYRSPNLNEYTHNHTITFGKLSVSGVVDIECSHAITVVLKNDGTVLECGYYIRLEYPDFELRKVKVPKMKGISCGGNQYFFITKNGNVWVDGSNTKCQLGFDSNGHFINNPVKIDTISDVKSIAAGEEHTIFLKEDGTVYGCGDNEFGQLGLGDDIDRSIPTKIDIPKVKKIYAEYNCRYTLFELENGDIYQSGTSARWFGKYNKFYKPTLIVEAAKL